MQPWNEIRHKVLVDKVSKREIRRDYRLGSETLEKILSHPQTPGYRLDAPRPKPVVGDFVDIIDQILIYDREAPVKQSHSAKRIFERLRDEYDTKDPSPTCVRSWPMLACVSVRRVRPAQSAPREAQFDFGEATVCNRGDRVRQITTGR